MSSNQKNANIGHNSQANAVDKIISDVMRGAKQDGRRQAELTIAMFNMEVTYSAEAILNVFRKEGKDKTEAMDKFIRGVSDSFVKAQDQIAFIKAIKPKSRSNREVFEYENLSSEIKAARAMFERALYGAYWLRVNNAKIIKLNTYGGKSVTVELPEYEKGTDGKAKATGTYETKLLSCADITANGKGAVDRDTGKRTATAKAENPAGKVNGNGNKDASMRSLADSSKALTAVLSGDAGKTPITDFDDTLRTQLNMALRQLFAMSFLDDRGTVDQHTLNKWIADNFPAQKREGKPAPKAA